jgi:hypothetical protein
MDDITIPEDFYILNVRHINYLLHRSCIVSNCMYSNYMFSNYKCVCMHSVPRVGDSISTYINILRNICNIYDEIEEKTYFINSRFYDLSFNVSEYTFSIHLRVDETLNFFSFDNVNGFLEYLAENYPKSIRNDDIKIALKD